MAGGGGTKRRRKGTGSGGAGGATKRASSKKKSKHENDENFLLPLVMDLAATPTVLDAWRDCVTGSKTAAITTLFQSLEKQDDSGTAQPKTESSSLLSSSSSSSSRAAAQAHDTTTTTTDDHSSLSHALIYKLFLATHVLQRLLTEPKTTMSRTAAASAAATARLACWLSYRCARILTHEKKVEKVCGPPSRNMAGRLMLAVTAAAVHGLQQLLNNSTGSPSDDKDDDDDNDDNDSSHDCCINRRACLAAVLALDAVVHWGNSSSASSSSSTTTTHHTSLQQEAAFWNSTRDVWQTWIEESLATDMAETVATIQEEGMDCWNQEQAFWEALLKDATSNSGQSSRRLETEPSSAAAASTTPNKRGASRRTTSTSATAAAATTTSSAVRGNDNNKMSSALNNLLGPLDAIAMDGRLACKRWSSVALVWFLNGQERLLQAMQNLLENVLDESGTAAEEENDDKLLLQSNTVVTMVSRVFHVVWEAGNHGGARAPPSGGVEAYMRALNNNNNNNNKAGGQQPPQKKSKAGKGAGTQQARSDLRHLATVVLYKLIDVHCDSLSGNDTTSVASLVNDDSNPSVVACAGGSSSSSLSVYPFVHRAIEDLARAASASVSGALFPDQSEWTNRIECAAASFVFQRQFFVENSNPLDARLTQFAVSRLVHCLNASEKEETELPASDDLEKKKEMLKLHEPLPVPIIAALPAKRSSSSRKKKAALETASAVNSFCSFAGVYHDTTATRKGGSSNLRTSPSEEKLSLFFRSARKDRDEDVEVSAVLLSHLIEIAERCYDTRSTSRNSTAVPATSTRSKKRKAAEASSNRKKKKRKKGNSGEEESGGVDASEASSLSPMGSVRAMLASETFKALSTCLGTMVAGNSRPKLRSQFRSCLTTDHIFRIVDLGLTVDEFVKKVRVASVLDSSTKDSTEEDPMFPSDERVLWNSYMDLCIVLGQGHDSSGNSKLNVLGDARMAVYEKIMSFRAGAREDGSWPLWLPASHCALIASNLRVETVSGEKEHTAADRFIVDGFIAGIEAFLRDPNLLLQSCITSPASLYVEEGTPLSLNHSRLFAGAVARLPPHERVSRLSSLLTAVQSGLAGINTDELDRSLVCNDRECASFVARAISTCTSLFVALTCSSSLSEKLLRVAGTSRFFRLPETQSRFDWHQTGKRFVSLFDDKDSLTLNETDLSVSSMDADSCEQLQAILMQSFTLGFSVAPVDQCYLLFASWNALGLSDLWSRNEINIKAFSGLSDDLPGLVLELRNELCCVNRLVQKVSGNSFGSPLLRIIDQKDDVNRARSRKMLITTVKRELRAMVSKASAICDDVLRRYVPVDVEMNQVIPPEAFALLEVLAVYLSFAVASYTKPHTDFFSYTRSCIANSRTRKRTRTYSSDSENYQSEVDSMDSGDVAIEAVERLQNVCSAFGAVPAYPDWLDVDCRLWEDISYAEATETARLALDTLTKLASAGWEQYEVSQRRAMTFSRRSNLGPDAIAEIALNLSRLDHYDAGISSFGASAYSDGTRNLQADVCAVCGIDAMAAFALWMGDGLERSRDVARQIWLQNSAQRILGGLQDIIGSEFDDDLGGPEFRAAGEWEVLLADGLTSSVIECSPADGAEGIRLDSERLARAESWRCVYLAALDSLVPTAALLRFGICKGGRKPHPLRSIETDSEDFEYSELVEDLPRDVSVPESMKDAVLNTLAILSRDLVDHDLTCEAAAVNLLVDAKAFPMLRGVQATSFALITLVGLQDLITDDDDVSYPLRSLFERIASVLEVHGGSDPGDYRRMENLSAALGIEDHHVRTLLDLSLWETLSAVDNASHHSLSTSSDRGRMNESFLRAIISCIWRGCNHLDNQTRLFFLRALCTLSGVQNEERKPHEVSPAALSHITEAFNACSDGRLMSLVKGDICNTDGVEDQTSSGNLCSARFLLCSLLAVVLADGPTKFARADEILDVLEKTLYEWSKLPMEPRQDILNLMFLYACRCKKLHTIGSKLMDDITADSTQYADRAVALENLASFSGFMHELYADVVSTEANVSKKSPDEKPSAPLPLTCSYVAKAGFHDQHWYNCYTCGLTDGKGCCSLCALVCHQGHDVSYSRFGGFFCDCGAEDRSGDAAKQVSCRCLEPLEEEKVASAFELGRRFHCHSAGTSGTQGISNPVNRIGLSSTKCAKIANSSFTERTQESLDDLIRKASESDWMTVLLELSRSQFQVYRSSISKGGEIDALRGMPSYKSLRRQLSERKGTADAVRRMSDETFVLLANFRAGTFQVKVSLDSSVDSLKRTLLSSNGACRSAISADSRGRIVIAETNSLLFCSGLPITNPSASVAPDSFQTRSSICVLGTKTVDFNIVGMKHCRANEGYLLVWGTHEASCFVLDENRNGVDRTLALELGLGSLESGSDIVLRCDWLPGSASYIVAVCQHSILFFDLSGNETTVSPTASINISSDTSFRGLVSTELLGERNETQGKAWKVFVLMVDGHLHAFDLKRDECGEIVVSNLNLEPKQSIKLPINGAPGDTFSLTLGEGVHLSYMEQSRLLLYQAASENVLALQIDTQGKIIASFTLLPRTILTESTGSETGGPSITGPFTHWTELGVVRHEATFFRLSCIGKRSSTKDPVLLCVEFNGTETRVIELPWLANGSSYSSSPSVDGIAAFSAPSCTNDHAQYPDPSIGPTFDEKVFMAALLSNGALAIYAEGSGTPIVSSYATSRKTGVGFLPLVRIGSSEQQSPMPLLFFERLTNVMDTDDVVFTVNGESSEDIRKKLQRDSDMFLASPLRQGFTLLVRLKPKSSYSGSDPSHVIVALRMLVGSTSSDAIPRKISVEGRTTELPPGLKKWYSFYLTASEIALSLRNGFVAIEIGRPYDCSSFPFLDAIEVYTAERKQLESWIPTVLPFIARSEDPSSPTNKTNSQERAQKPLLLSLQALNHFYELLTPCKSLKLPVRSFLEQSIRETALDENRKVADAVEALLVSFESDEDLRESLRDKAILLGCSDFLSRCQEVLGVGTEPEEDFETRWQTLQAPLSRCFRTAAHIAKCRPINYFQSVDSACSPGVQASKFVTSCFARTLSTGNLISEFVELCLVEMAVATASGADYNARTSFGNFDGLRSLLLNPNENAVVEACSTISRFCEKYESQSTSAEGGYDLFAAQKMVAYYRCDSCELFPIKDIRYTLLDDDHPFDLCQECYTIAKQYAAIMDYSERRDVVIRGRTVGEETKLSCAEVKMMHPIDIQKPGESSKGEHEDVEMQHSEEEECPPCDTNGTEVVQRQQLFDDFTDRLFIEVINLLVDDMKKPRRTTHLLTNLAISIVQHSGEGGLKFDRAKRLGKELVLGLSNVLLSSEGTSDIGDSMEVERSLTIAEFLRALTNIIVSDDGALAYICGQEKGLESANDDCAKGAIPTCDVHGIPAVRRKCGPGPNKDRPFYICGKDHKLRCNFFAWADRDDGSKPKSLFDKDVAKIIWDLFVSTLEGTRTPVQAQLCGFVTSHTNRTSLLRSGSDTENGSFQVKGYDLQTIRQDFADGVFCSRGRLQDESAQQLLSRLRGRVTIDRLRDNTSVDANATVVEASLVLFGLIASPKGEALPAWSPLLCEIILSLQATNPLNPLSKRALMKLCDMRRSIYLSIRAHHAFASHREKLVAAVENVLMAGLVVREKARQCGPSWKSGKRLSWADVRAGSLLGTEDLVSEDVTTVRCIQNEHRILVELLSIAKKRGDHWRRFCGMEYVPESRTHVADVHYTDIFNVPPAAVLFFVACLMKGEPQIEAFRLLDLALTNTKGKKKAAKESGNLTSDDDDDHDDVDIVETYATKETTAFPFASGKTPEKVLMLTVDEALAFALRFVSRGATPDLRLVSCNILSKICFQSDPSMAGVLFQRLIVYPLCVSGDMGKCHVELLTLLHMLLRRASPDSIDVSAAAARIQSYWKQQMHAIRQDRSNLEYVYFETRTNTSSQKKRYELSRCANCHQLQSGRKDKGKTGATQPPEHNAQGSSSVIATSSNRPSSVGPPYFLSEQVTVYSRGRLEGWRVSSVSDEFSMYSSFKYRLALSHVHLEVNDPRGRFVKTITIYFAPRPVSNVNELKSQEYADKWQRCGTVHLSKGATRATCTLDTPVIAANLKIEYTDFYERTGQPKSTDGSFVVHCPRCTRVVTNAHGVCGSCGEVAFQCRKCRHINYDRLDAFLCVECGFCVSGGFVFELTAALASNAIAICNDQDYDRSCQMFCVATRLYEDLNSILRERLSTLLNKPTRDGESAQLRRAFQGGLPLPPGVSDDEVPLTLAKLGKLGSVIKAVARPDGRLHDSRAQSLLRLTKEWRNTANDERRADDTILRHLIRQEEDESSDFFGVLDRVERGGNDDPLSRLLASVQSRRARRTATSATTERQGGDGSSGTGSQTAAQKSKTQVTKETLDICDRLHVLMREAERESYRLEQRILAWRRLETDSLIQSAGSVQDLPLNSFQPSHCSICASPIALQLLTLWLALLEKDPEKVLITQDMVHWLLSEEFPILYRTLLDTKRRAVKEIALRSKQGADVVLEALKIRLEATESTACAEILGKIVEEGGPDKFTQLLFTVLERSTARSTFP